MPKYNENRVKSNNSTLKSASDHETVNLVTIQNNRAVTTSLQVAEYFGKEHSKVLRAIRMLDCSDEFNQANFGFVTYQDAKGEQRPMYYLTRDGFTLLAMGFTGKVAARFKEAYIKAFNLMEESLKNGNFSDYANDRLIASVKILNKRLRLGIKKGQEKYGPAYTPVSEIPHGIFVSKELTFEENLKNMLAQVSCAFGDAYYLVYSLYKKDQEIKEQNKLIQSIIDELRPYIF